jgi:hypothetical protein
MKVGMSSATTALDRQFGRSRKKSGQLPCPGDQTNRDRGLHAALFHPTNFRFDHRGELRDAALEQSAVAGAPAVIVVAAVPAWTRAKYGARCDRFVALEAGHVTQNILLEATEHSLAAVPSAALIPHACGGLSRYRPRTTSSISYPSATPAEPGDHYEVIAGGGV